jgi:hypothetical protein
MAAAVVVGTQQLVTAATAAMAVQQASLSLLVSRCVC